MELSREEITRRVRERRGKKGKSRHLTDMASDGLQEVGDGNDVPGPSSNPATNLIISDILIRGIGRLTRQTIEKAMLGKKYGSEVAKQTVENRSMAHTLTAYGITKFATKSVPGALIVTSGIAAKVLFDLGKSRRQSRKDGDKFLRQQADPDSMV